MVYLAPHHDCWLTRVFPKLQTFHAVRASVHLVRRAGLVLSICQRTIRSRHCWAWEHNQKNTNAQFAANVSGEFIYHHLVLYISALWKQDSQCLLFSSCSCSSALTRKRSEPFWLPLRKSQLAPALNFLRESPNTLWREGAITLTERSTVTPGVGSWE